MVEHNEAGSSRRGFLRNAAAGLAAIGPALGQSGRKVSPIAPGTNTSFAQIRQIDAGLLNVGYADAGPANGPAVVLLHGWPYDIHSYVDVAPTLASAGYRVIVPYLRGYGRRGSFRARHSQWPTSRGGPRHRSH